MRSVARGNGSRRPDRALTPLRAWNADCRRRSVHAHQLTGNAQRDLLRRLYNAGDLPYEVACRWAAVCEREAQANLAACETSVQG